MNTDLSNQMRIWHRYLGFFLAGIMAMYALSGFVLIYRTTDFLKKEKVVERTLEANLSGEALGRELRIRGFQPTKTEGDIIYFEQGQYNSTTGQASYTEKSLPLLLDKMTKLHKANTNSPLYYLNIFFAFSLLFFVVSAFWMFRPKTSVFKKGMYFTAGGFLLVLILMLY